MPVWGFLLPFEKPLGSQTFLSNLFRLAQEGWTSAQLCEAREEDSRVSGQRLLA